MKRQHYKAITDDSIFANLLAKAFVDVWAQQDLPSCSDAMPRQPADTGDLHI